MDDEVRRRLELAGTHVERAIAAGTRFEFVNDPIGMAAVAHLIEQLGEQFVAIERLDPDLVAAHPEIPWRAVQGTRHRIVHGYEKVDTEVIRGIIEDRLPLLLRQLEALLERPEP